MSSQEYESRAQEESRHRLSAYVRGLRKLADELREIMKMNIDAEALLQSGQKKHPQYSQGDLIRTVGYIWLPFVLIAAYSVDYILFSSTAEFFARRTFNSRPMIMLSQILCPALILILDLAVGVKRHAAKVEWDRSGKRVAYYVWTALGILVAFVMPAIAVSNTFAVLPSMDDKMMTGFALQALALGLVALLTHLLILFWGEQVQESKAFLFYTLSQSWLRWKIARGRRKHDRKLRNFKNTFDLLISQRKMHQWNHPEPPLESLVLDSGIRNLLDKHYPEWKEIRKTEEEFRSNGHMKEKEDRTTPAGVFQNPQEDGTNRHEEAEQIRIRSLHAVDQKLNQEWPG